MAVAYKPRNQRNIIGGMAPVSPSLKQFRIAETEKYAHVTSSFNGGREQPF